MEAAEPHCVVTTLVVRAQNPVDVLSLARGVLSDAVFGLQVLIRHTGSFSPFILAASPLLRSVMLLRTDCDQ